MRSKYVIDSSVCAYLYLETSFSKYTEELFNDTKLGLIELYAPKLIEYEMLSILIKCGLFSTREITTTMNHLLSLIEKGFILIQDPFSYSSTISIATSNHSLSEGYISSYDACFHALALEIGATLITNDKKYFNKVSNKFGSIQLLETYKTPVT